MNNLAAVMTNANIDRQSLLGYMCFYYMPGIKLKQDELETIFNNNQMSVNYLPQKIYGHDAYRRVTGKIRGTVDVNANGGIYAAKLNIDEVRNDFNEIVRVLGRKLTDSMTDSVTYETVAAFSYDKSTEDMSYTMNSAYESEYDYEQQILIPATQAFTEAMVYHNKDTVRTIINRIFQAQNPVTIIKGSYFIPKNHEDEMMSLSNVIKDLSSYADDATDTPGMRIIPLLDTVEQRDLIEKKASGELAKELDDITLELTQVLTSNKGIRDVTLLRLNKTFQALRDKTNEYSTLLNIKLGNTEALFVRAIELFSNVKNIGADVA